jgi:hypothetical protein
MFMKALLNSGSQYFHSTVAAHETIRIDGELSKAILYKLETSDAPQPSAR